MRRTIKNGREHLLQDIFAANFLFDSESTDVAKVNDFRRVVVNVKSQKSVIYILCVQHSRDHAQVIHFQIY